MSEEKKVNKNRLPNISPRRRRLRTSLLAATAIFLLLMVILISGSIAAYYIFLSAPVQKRVIAFAEEKLSEYFLGDITIERFETNLVSQINLYGVRAIGKSEHRDSIYVGRISINYWTPSLVHRQINITSAEIYDIRGHVVMEEGSKIMLPFLPMRLLDEDYNMLSKFNRPEYQYRDYRGNIEAYRALPRDKRQTLSTDIPRMSDYSWQVVIGQVEVDGINATYRDFANDMVGTIRNSSATANFHALDSFTAVLRIGDAEYRSPWWNGVIDTIGAKGTVTWTGLDVHSMFLRGSTTHVTGRGYLSYFPDGPWDLSADFMTTVNPVSILYEYTPQLGREGVFEGSASYKGRLYDPIWNSRVRGIGITYDWARLDSFDASADYGTDERGRARIRGSSRFGQFDINAVLVMKDIMFGGEFEDYSVNANLTRLDIDEIMGGFNVKSPFEMNSGTVRVTASGTNFEPPRELALDASASMGEEKGSAVLNAELRDGAWTVGGGWGNANNFYGRGRINFETGALTGEAETDMSDPAAVVKALINEEASGRLILRANFSMNMERPEYIKASANFRGEEARWRGMFADSIEADITFENKTARLDGASGHVSGRVDSIAAYLGYDMLGGYVAADFSMRGGRDDFIVNTYLRARELYYEDNSLDTVSGFISMTDGTVSWNHIFMRGMGITLESAGSVTFAPHLELDIAADLFNEQNGERVSAGRLEANGKMVDDSASATWRATSFPLHLLDPWIPAEHRARGVATVSGEIFGALANPAARVNFRFVNPKYSEYDAHSLIGDVMIADSIITGAAILRLTPLSEAIELRTRLPVLPSSDWAIDESGSRAAIVTVSTNELEVADITDRFEELNDFEIYGKATVDAGMGNIGFGWTLGGTAAVSGGYMRHDETRVSVRDIAVNAYLGGTIEKPKADFLMTTGRVRTPWGIVESGMYRGTGGIDTLVLDSAQLVFTKDGVINAKGEIIYTDHNAILHNGNLSASYEIKNLPAETFAQLLPGIEISGGEVSGVGTVTSGGGRPLAAGTLALSRGSFLLTDVNPSVGPIDAGVELSDSSIHITYASGRWGRGELNAYGSAYWNLEGLHGVEVNTRALDLAFELPEVVFVGVERADLQITDRAPGFFIRGRATLGPTSYIEDINFLEMLNQAQMGHEARRAPDPFLETIGLHIELDLANRMGIDMNLGNLTMDGRITIGGTAAEPGIIGRINIADGYVYYIDRRFNIVEGTIFNPAANEFNPNIRITAQANVVAFSSTARAEFYTITLNMTGNLEEPVLRFTSDPPLSELDILSVLTFGERLGGLGSDINSRLANIAAQQVIGIGARRVEKLLHLDRISVTGNVLGAGSAADATEAGSSVDGITIGTTKRFTNRLSVTYEVNTGSQVNQRASAQYRLLRNVYLEGETTSEGENAANILFRYSR